MQEIKSDCSVFRVIKLCVEKTENVRIKWNFEPESALPYKVSEHFVLRSANMNVVLSTSQVTRAKLNMAWFECVTSGFPSISNDRIGKLSRTMWEDDNIKCYWMFSRWFYIFCSYCSRLPIEVKCKKRWHTKSRHVQFCSTQLRSWNYIFPVFFTHNFIWK